MASKDPSTRIKTALRSHQDTTDFLQRLKLSQQIREAAEDLEAQAIKEARENGTTWGDIGACYGLSKQGAQQRFKNTRPRKSATKRKHPSRE